MSDHLATNLRYLCAEKPSVAQVCREIGINHQQFSKYLSGRAKPSAHNLRRIAAFFGLEDTQLLGPHDELVGDVRRQKRSLSDRRRDPFAVAFPGDIGRLRPLLGAYQVHFLSPAAPGSIVVNAAFLDERDGVVHSRLVETLFDRSAKSRRWTRCDGKAAYHNGRIFVIDYEEKNEGAFTMSILIPPHRHKKQYLFGKMSFLASLPRRTPFASDVVWKRVADYKSPRDVLRSCGLYAADSRKIDPVIRNYLATGREETSLGN
ncbi:helix-turn-helix transcriptional regulator [uncultured Roseovarius sp.]|uniref:helix-turn-helix domain-containing protein n=1 Tax=uncultured Roseovarius sp. TaxID=293344 RepID=UPI0025D33AD7|nr:helix-turn-helix transcriptional regulator [uncultured Roseovarius sp.]